MPFVVSFGGEEWRTDDLLLDEAISIEEDTGRGWMEINPFRSAVDCKAILLTFMARSMDRAVAAQKLAGVPIGEILDGVRVVRDDLPDVYEDGVPKAEGGPSTDG